MKFKTSPPNTTSSPPVEKWQLWFAWRPVRIAMTTVAWLETVARLPIPSRWRKLGSMMIMLPNYRYGPATHALTQPGVLQGVGSQLSPGISPAQASGTAVQSGLGGIVGNPVQGVPVQGNTNVSVATQGGLNVIAQKPGP